MPNPTQEDLTVQELEQAIALVEEAKALAKRQREASEAAERRVSAWWDARKGGDGPSR
jgi:hypothetical protein